MKIDLTMLVLILVGTLVLGSLLGYGVSEGFSSGPRYRCKEYVDMSKYILKTECPPQPDMSLYVLKSEVPPCPPCICGCNKPCKDAGKCPPCPRPRCPPQRTPVCPACPACPEPVPMKCPRPEIIIKEKIRGGGAGWNGGNGGAGGSGDMWNVKPVVDPVYGIYGNY